MSISRTRTSRVFTISFPEALARQVEETAREESRNISELFREAFRTYKFQMIERQLAALRPTLSSETPVVTEAEIQTYIKSVRSEMSDIRKHKLDRRP